MTGGPSPRRTRTAAAAAASSPRVAALRPADLAVAEADHGPAPLGEVLEVPARADPGDAQQTGRLRCGHVLATTRDVAQELLDQLQRLGAEALRQGLVGAGDSGDAEQPVHVGLVRLVAGHRGVRLLV